MENGESDRYCLRETETNQYKQAQFKNQCKLAAHAVLEMFCFCLCHLSTGKVKHFLTATHINSIHYTISHLFHQLQDYLRSQNNSE